MIKNYFLITWRSMLKNKLFIFINIVGLAIAIGQCITGYFAYEYDATFDGIHENASSIYRVSSIRDFEGNQTRYGYAPFPLGDIIAKTFDNVDASTHYYHSYANFKIDDNLFPASLRYVDPAFFNMFTFDFLAGDPKSIQDKSTVLVSESVAVRLFGSAAEAVNQPITQVYGRNLKEVKIGGVFKDPPMNSSFFGTEGSSYMHFDNYKDEHTDIGEYDWKNMCAVYVQVKDPAWVASVSKQLQSYVENNNQAREDFKVAAYVLDPLPTMAHQDRAEDANFGTWPAAPISAIVGSNVMGVLVLLLACFNLTNTTIAISSRRLKEIGIRKVMGSMRKHLIVQYLSETVFICLLALALGLLMADVMIRGWNYMWQYFQLSPHYLDNPTFLLFLAGLLIFVAVAAGAYPAFYISQFSPVTILKGKLRFAGTNYFTRILLGLQFSISLISIVAAIGFLQNAAYQRNYDLGFDAKGTVVAWVNDGHEFETYRNALAASPLITSIAGARSGIFSNRINDPVKSESRQIEADIIEVGDNYLHAMDLKLLQGRDFIKHSETDRKESVIVTEQLARSFGWSEPLGKEIIWKDTVRLYVVGVIRDVYTMGLWREMEPMLIRYILPDQYTQLVATGPAEDVVAIHEVMKKEWNKLFPNRLYNGHMMNENLAEVQNVNVNIVYMFGFMGLVTLLLSATGLFTLVSLNIIKRMKEIGVRKVMGASVGNITRIVNMEFVIILALASMLGSWAGYVQSDLIMGSIWRYYQSPNVMTFVFSVSALFLISFIAIGHKIFKAATMNPVDSLKEE